MTNSFKYVRDNGITLDTTYPYIAVAGKCQIAGGSFKISGYTGLGSCADLTYWVLKGVVSASVDATNWKAYQTGVFSDCSNRINHAVAVTGINSGNWVVKNSWGTSWGNAGYMTIQGGNTCGICYLTSFPNK